MRVMVLGNGQRAGVSEEAERLLPFLRDHCDIVVFDLSQTHDLSAIEAELTLVLGGDGASLREARQMGYKQVPVLGVNLGKLGFLADLTPEELCEWFPRVVKGEYRVTHHLMLECVVESPGQSRTILGLNEVFVHTGPSFHSIDLDLAIDGD